MAQSTVEYPKRDVESQVEQAPILVLHVDDEAGFLKAAKQILEMQGAFEVETASSVEEANEKMKEKTYDAIVCDYIMPRKDGLQFLKELRDNGNNIPFIIFTGKGREMVAIKALNLGADQYVNKIGHPEAVYGELAHAIGKIVEASCAEERLRKSQERFRDFFENAPIGFHIFGPNRIITDINETELAMIDYTRDEIVGKKTWGALIVPEQRDQLERHWQNMITEGEVRELEYTLVHKDGHHIDVLLNASSRFDEHGNLINTRGSVLNITERKKAEAELKKAAIYLDAMGDALIVLNLQRKVVKLNKAAMELFGYSPEEIPELTYEKLFPKREHKKHYAEMEIAIKTGTTRPLDTFILTKDGREIPVLLSGTAMKDNQGKLIGFVGVCRDITERKRAGEGLKESEKKFRKIFESANDAIIYGDLKGTILDLNRKAVKLAGIEREKILGKNFSKLGLISLRDVPKLLGRLARKALGKADTEGFQLAITRKDGEKRFFEVNSTLIRKGKMPAGFLAIARDITERKKMQDKIEKMNEKLSVVGKLTRHDARNKLSTITMNTFLIKQKLTDDPEALKHLTEVESACGDVERIFDFARIYERIGAEELAYLDVEKTVEETVRFFPFLHDVKVLNDCCGLTVLADSLLRQLFYNLIDNSLKHSQKVSQIRAYYEEAGKGKLKLVYEDDGVGIPKAEKKRIFEEGYGKGTGYGLYLIRKMCDVYGWTIRETGKQGKGAQFTITIPQVGESGKANYQLR